jgi:4-hydroxy-tetrahydrodipicolinate synthase
LSEELALKVSGIITALVTPFDDEGRIAESALRDIIDFQIRENINGLFPCGSTGQAALMSLEERERVAEIVVEHTRGRVPVIIQVGCPDTSSTVRLAKHAERIGADAIGCVSPYYYSSIDEGSILEHFKLVAESVTVPVFIYNIPRYTGINLRPPLVSRIAKIPNVVGIKDSSHDFMQLLSLLGTMPEDFTVINGSDASMFPAFIMGAKAAVAASGNAVPEICTSIYRSAVSGDHKAGVKEQFRLNTLLPVLNTPTIAPLMECLRLRGIKAGKVRSPLRELSDKEALNIAASLKAVHLLA